MKTNARLINHSGGGITQEAIEFLQKQDVTLWSLFGAAINHTIKTGRRALPLLKGNLSQTVKRFQSNLCLQAWSTPPHQHLTGQCVSRRWRTLHCRKVQVCLHHKMLDSGVITASDGRREVTLYRNTTRCITAFCTQGRRTISICGSSPGKKYLGVSASNTPAASCSFICSAVWRAIKWMLYFIETTAVIQNVGI